MKFIERLNKLLPPKKGARITLFVLIIAAVIASIFVGKFVSNFVASMTIVDLPGKPVARPTKQTEPDSEDNNQNPSKPVATLPSSNVDLPDPWDGTSRVNMLFMGLDYRDWEAGDIPRTDTMILFSFDPIGNTASMISIPRDLWVSIPGFDYEKINTAYFLGESWKIPGGGPGLAMKTVEQLLGVPIQYYLQLDFYAFVSFIDHIDGVKIDIPQEIDVVLMGTNEIETLYPGRVVLPGDIALAYARARYTEGGDFDRAQRQQQIIMGVINRITEFKMVPTLIANADKLYADLSAGINTNLSLNDGIRLGLRVLDIPKENIKNTVISGSYVTLEKSPEGLDILRPVPDKIRLLRDEFFSSGAAVGPVSVAKDLIELVKMENAAVGIYNGSSVAGLAEKTADYLRSKGLNIVEVANSEYSIYSQVTLKGSKPYTLKYLFDTMTISSNRVFNRYDPASEIDLVLILGDDWANNNPIP